MNPMKMLIAAVTMGLSVLILSACLHSESDAASGPTQAEFDALKQTVNDQAGRIDSLEATVADLASRLDAVEANAGPVKLRSASSGSSGKVSAKSALPSLSCNRLSHTPANAVETAALAMTCQHPDTGYLASFPLTTGGSFGATPITGTPGHNGHGEVYFDQAGCGGNAYIGRAQVSPNHGAKHGVMFSWKDAEGPTYWYVPAGTQAEQITSLSVRNVLGECVSENVSRTVYAIERNDPAVTGFESGEYAGPNLIQ